MKLRAIFTAAALASTISAAKPEEVYFRGLGEIFSAGVCAIGPGSCHSYLFVENVISDLCERRPSPLNVVGHSLGAGAAMRLVWGAAECGLKVHAAVFLDPLVHPFNIPAQTKVRSFYTPAFSGSGDGKADAERVGNLHVLMTFDASLMSKVRSFIDQNGKAGRK